MESLVVTAAEVEAFASRLADGVCAVEPADLIDLIAALERLKSTACAVQAEAVQSFDVARRAENAAAGVPQARQGRGVASEIALARKESPSRGRVMLGMARSLTHEMPHTLARLKDGTLSEFRALLLVRETACLTVEDRLLVDKCLCADPSSLEGVGTRALILRAKRLSAELDPAAVTRRARKAEADRHVSVRPAPDTMGYLTGLMPVAQAVAAYAALRKSALAARAEGDARSLGQLMSDLLLSRLTGLPDTGSADQAPAVPVTLDITIAESALAGGHAPATLTGPGVGGEALPAEIARNLAAHALHTGVGTWFRRLHYNPLGACIAMSTKQRFFPAAMADFLALRGVGICATPYCDAPIRHYDHIQAVQDGGTTAAINGQGLCEACNHAKQAAQWWQHVVSEPWERPTVETITPTGHRYTARVPEPPGWRDNPGATAHLN